MNALAALLITRSLDADRVPESRYPDSDPLDEAPKPRPGFGTRVRKLFRPRKRVTSEPGFAATSGWLSEFVPSLSSYPYMAPSAYR